MKKLLCLLLVLLLPNCAFALTGPAGETLPDAPLWQAILRIETRIRTVKDMNSTAWLGKIPELTLVDIYQVADGWATVKYGEDVGYIPHERFFQFYRLTEEPLPDTTVVEGVATMTDEAFLTVDGYTGNLLQSGQLLCSRRLGIVPMMRVQAQLAAKDYTFEPFVQPEESKPGDAVYGFTTFYNESLGGKYPENREFNIELAVERLQGIVIGPGEKFSFNQYCGPYTKQNGYQMAKNVSKDGYGYGGGVCQVSTTIFNAIQGFDYQLDEWNVHSYVGVKYVPRNLDAAVASSRDFSFYNKESIPLAMAVMAQDGVLTVIFRHAAEVPEKQAGEPAGKTE
ncbi:MAG: VanW family protein [Clostridia bacterium]|nr:VanW family protein [Clostridia bacterium]